MIFDDSRYTFIGCRASCQPGMCIISAHDQHSPLNVLLYSIRLPCSNNTIKYNTTIEKTKKNQKNLSPVLKTIAKPSRKPKKTKKTKDPQGTQGPETLDTRRVPMDCLGVLGFFGFFWFSRWFSLPFPRHALVSFVFLVFSKVFTTFWDAGFGFFQLFCFLAACGATVLYLDWGNLQPKHLSN